eukprot:SAG31_NODE_42169_length_272_cov_3.861272_1_plen_71_part_01
MDRASSRRTAPAGVGSDGGWYLRLEPMARRYLPKILTNRINHSYSTNFYVPIQFSMLNQINLKYAETLTYS